ncbi:MAG: hypothetical protein AAGC46_06545 [Solirubrobacteraceae bacterium]|nr:hypothetical protein [Patulibacter sp.]
MSTPTRVTLLRSELLLATVALAVGTTIIGVVTLTGHGVTGRRVIIGLVAGVVLAAWKIRDFDARYREPESIGDPVEVVPMPPAKIVRTLAYALMITAIWLLLNDGDPAGGTVFTFVLCGLLAGSVATWTRVRVVERRLGASLYRELRPRSGRRAVRTHGRVFAIAAPAGIVAVGSAQPAPRG